MGYARGLILTKLVFIAPKGDIGYMRIWYKDGFHAFCNASLYRSSNDKKNMQDTSESMNEYVDWFKRNRKRFKYGVVEASSYFITCNYTGDIWKIPKWEFKAIRNKSLYCRLETLDYYNLEQLADFAKKTQRELFLGSMS